MPQDQLYFRKGGQPNKLKENGDEDTTESLDEGDSGGHDSGVMLPLASVGPVKSIRRGRLTCMSDMRRREYGYRRQGYVRGSQGPSGSSYCRSE